MKYTIRDLQVDFPDEDACLAWLVEWIYPDGITCKTCLIVTKHHKLKKRKVYCCDRCGQHVSPTSGTIFHKSSTPLSIWYHCFYMMSSNKAGTSAMQIMRETGVSYPTAHRMMHKIRSLMEASEKQLEGEAELDETFVHPNPYKRSSAGKKFSYDARRTGSVIFGMVQRNGEAKVWHVKSTGARVLLPIIEQNIKPGTLIHTDGFGVYRTLSRRGYQHRWTEHGKHEYYTPDSSTQNIENLWSHFKRGIKGVYRHVNDKYLQLYAQEYAWRYSHRNDVSMFWSLMSKITSSGQRSSKTS